MEVTKYKLTNVCDFQGGSQPPKKEWSKNKEDGFVRMLQIRDFTQREKNNIEYVKESNRLKKCKTDDVLIGRYGASIGKILTGLEGAYNVAIIKAIPNEKHLNKQYLLALLRGPIFQNFIQNIGGRAAQAGFNKEDLSKFNLSLPSLDNQKRIAQVLTNCENLIQKRKESICLLDELLKSTFLEMFGDPVRNDKKLKFVSLAKYGDFKNGLNYAKNEVGLKVRYLGVGDFKKHNRISDMHLLKEISLSKKPSDDYFLKDGDLVFVRSNGNKELVGRCVVVNPENEKVTFSGFCIRFRPKSELLNTLYLSHLFTIENFKKKMLQSGRGANIQNINQKLLGELKIPLPAPEQQQKFVDIVEKTEAIKKQYQTHLEELENLYGSISQKAFKGELDLSKVKISGFSNAASTTSGNLDSVIDIKIPVAGSLEPPKEEEKRPKFSKKELEGLKTKPKVKRDITNLTILDYYGVPKDLQYTRENAEFEIADWDIHCQFLLKDTFPDRTFTLQDIQDNLFNYFYHKGDMDFDNEAWKEIIFKFLGDNPPLLEQLFDETDNTIKLKLTDEAFKA